MKRFVAFACLGLLTLSATPLLATDDPEKEEALASAALEAEIERAATASGTFRRLTAQQSQLRHRMAIARKRLDDEQITKSPSP